MPLRRSAHHRRARWIAAQTGLQQHRGSGSKFVLLRFHHLVLCLLGRGHFREVSQVGFLCALSLAPLCRSRLPVRAGVNAAIAFADLETFLFRAAQGWQGVLALNRLVCLDGEVPCRSTAVVLEAV